MLYFITMRQWPLYQLNIKNAFLHGDLEEVYLEQPPDFVARGSVMGMSAFFTRHCMASNNPLVHGLGDSVVLFSSIA